MNLWQNYVVPASISEALEALAAAPGPSVPVAGGTDLLIDLDQGRHSPVHTLVDLTSIPEMTTFEVREGGLFIGSAVPLSRIMSDPLIALHCRALAEACALIGGPQVRNVATLGGNVAHALPAADGTIALLALDAVAEVASAAGTRHQPVGELFTGPGKSALKHGAELLVGFHLRLRKPNESSCFVRVMRPQGVALPIINLAVWLQRRGPIMADVRIAVGPGGPVPWRARQAERALAGETMSKEAMAHALDEVLAEAQFRSSARRASAEYRRHLIGVILNRAMSLAWQRALSDVD